MNAQKLIPLLDKIDALLENNKNIREELIRLISEKEEEPSLTDILGIKVYLGKDYVEPEDPKITIGEDLGNLEDIVKEEIEEYNSGFDGTYIVQDCAGNFIRVPPIEIPKSFNVDINRQLEILEDEYLEKFCLSTATFG